MITPILFLVFNRPDTTKQVFKKIREARPPRLYVAADGPRKLRKGEGQNCEQVRKIATDVDWECEVKTLYRDENLGCKMAVSGGIDWFFENEEMGIILEDDCLPNDSFFRFCEELLIRYQDDDRIMHINGNNYGADKSHFSDSDYSYHFGSMPQAWGWASWSRAWRKFNREISKFEEYKKLECISNVIQKLDHRRIQLERWESVKNGQIDTWDYQWQFSVISNNGLTVVPKKNLISNVGFGENATHTKNIKSLKKTIETRNMKFPVTHPAFIVPDKKLDLWYQENMFNTTSTIKKIINKVNRLFKKDN